MIIMPPPARSLVLISLVSACHAFAQVSPTATPTATSTAGVSTSQGFGYFSPEMAGRLKGVAEMRPAKAAVRNATKALSEEPKAVNPVKDARTQAYFDQGAQVCDKENAQIESMLNFALAYRITGDPAYLQAEEKYLKAWLPVYRLSFDPLTDMDLEKWIVVYDLTANDLSPETREKFTRFIKEMAAGYLRAFQGYHAAACNGRSIAMALATMASFATGDTVLINSCRNEFQKYKKIDIHPDGSLQDFYTRDALYYDGFDLRWLLKTCLVAKAHGEDWFRPEVGRAVDWLKPYALGEKKHRDFANSHAKADQMRANAGFASFKGKNDPNVFWDPKHSIDNLRVASMFDPSYKPVLEQVYKNTGSKEKENWYDLLPATGL